MTNPQVLWQPTPQQAKFLASRADEALYGGAAGGGKSAASVALPLRWVANPNFHALFLRRESKYLRDAIQKSDALYPKLGARRHQTTNTWTFPSGATVWLNHCEHENDIANYDSLEFSLIIFEELTHFTERQYLGIKARLRSPDPTLPKWVRATSNPGGVGHDWVFKRFGAWLDPTHPAPAAPTVRRWYAADDEAVGRGTPDALSRTFVGARLADNPHIGPEYRAQLLQLDPVRRAQLLGGDWLAKPAAGKYFKREWIRTYLDAAPPLVEARVRYWDLAAGGDYAAGALVSRTPLRAYVLEDLERLKGSPAEVRARVKATALRDGPRVPIYIEQDPGQAGKDQIWTYVSEPDLQGFEVRGRPKRVDKVTAFGPVSSQSEVGNYHVVRGAWNGDFFAEAEAFPEGDHDDQCDAVSGAHAVVALETPPTLEWLSPHQARMPHTRF